MAGAPVINCNLAWCLVISVMAGHLATSLASCLASAWRIASRSRDKQRSLLSFGIHHERMLEKPDFVGGIGDANGAHPNRASTTNNERRAWGIWRPAATTAAGQSCLKSVTKWQA